MSDGTRVLVGLGVGRGAGLAIAASHNPSLVGAANRGPTINMGMNANASSQNF